MAIGCTCSCCRRESELERLRRLVAFYANQRGIAHPPGVRLGDLGPIRSATGKVHPRLTG